jgi:menaquinone-dependent protoporphyrinogen oxidase
MNRRVLVLFASTHGHTRKIAARIGDVLRETGLHAEVIDVRDIAEEDLERFSAVIVGASIHAGKHQREMLVWTRLHAGWLQRMPAAFFSVCLTAAEDDEEAREASRAYVADFADETGWQPDRAESIAGALQYQEYDFFTRHLMRLMMKRGGHPTDTTRDVDYTDWAAVDSFAREFAAEAQGQPRPAPGPRTA